MTVESRDPDALLNESEAAQVLGVSVRTLQAWRAKKQGPPYATVGRLIRYRWQSLLDWIKTRIKMPMAN